MSPRLAPSRIVLSLAVLSAAGLAAAAIIHFPDLERAYHLRALRKEPGRFEYMLASPRPAKRAAAREFTKERSGREALMELFHEMLLSSSGGPWRQLEHIPGNAWGILATEKLTEPTEPEWERRREEVLDLLPACAGEIFRIPALEQEFLVQHGSELEPRWPDGAGPELYPGQIEELKQALLPVARRGRYQTILFFREAR